MKNSQWRTLAPALALLAGLILVTPALADKAPRDPNLNGGVILGPLSDVPEGPGDNWIDHFDTYATGSQMHGQGDWKGWDNVPSAGALTSSTQARSAPNSVDILAGTDLVHEYTGYTTGTWTYTAWQYIPTGYTGLTYFIMLNTYADGGPYNWSVQVPFDSVSGTMGPDFGPCSTGTPTLPIILDQWVEIRVVIDLDADLQTFFYGGQQLYQCSWANGGSGSGVANVGAVDLYANGATSVFYDDISLSNLPFLDGFESGGTSEWHVTVP